MQRADALHERERTLVEGVVSRLPTACECMSLCRSRVERRTNMRPGKVQGAIPSLAVAHETRGYGRERSPPLASAPPCVLSSCSVRHCNSNHSVPFSLERVGTIHPDDDSGELAICIDVEEVAIVHLRCPIAVEIHELLSVYFRISGIHHDVGDLMNH